MKKKLFTLLLAAVGLSIFQANAEQKLEGWIRVDKSGLAKNTGVSSPDSFPNKKLGFNSWLSVKDSTVYVHPSSNPTSSEIARDENSLFSVDSVGPGRFKIINSKNKAISFTGKWDTVDVDVSTFEIVQFDKTGKKVVPSITDNSIEGYVVFPFTGQDQTAGNAVLAGVDEDGKISFRAFSEFAAHSDSVPASPWLSYQFTKDTVKSKLYQSDTYPYFQTYHKDSALVASGGSPIDWNKGETKSQNPGIFTYYDFKYDGNGGIFFNNAAPVDLVDIVDYIKSGDYKESGEPSITEGKNLSGIDTTSFANDSLLYLQVDDKNHITFTALTAADGEWTNGEPSKLPCKSDSVWYYIDATDTTKAFYAMVQVLIGLFKFEEDHFIPSKSNIERYIYKNDDNWRPLYIRAVSVTQTKPYEYVTEDWLKVRDFDLVAATQHVFGFPDLAISEEATVVSTENAVRLSFEPAARIGIDSTISGLTGPKFADGDIELFHIKNGSNKYLTVDTVAYSHSGNDYTVTNTKLKWDNKIASTEGADTLRQAFAIVHDTDSSIFTFLPVASREYLGTTYGDLRYNLHIGERSKDDQGKDVSVDIDGAWHITYRSAAPQLVITDKPDDENVWLKLKVELNHWEVPTVYEDSTFTVVYGKGRTHHYSAAGKFETGAGALLSDSIRSHWRAKYVEPKDNKPRVIFTPRIDTIYGVAQHKALTDTVFALKLDEAGTTIELINSSDRSNRDTVEIGEIKSTYTLPFKNLDDLDSLKVAILASGSESYNLSNDNGNAVLKPITATSDTFRVVLHKSNVQTLADGLHVPYYIFSTPDSLFLRANIDTDSVEWVKPIGEKISLLLDKNNWNAEFAHYKFSLPYKDGTEGEDVYLQTLHSVQPKNYGLIVNGSILFSVNARNFGSVLKPSDKYVSNEGIYSALDQYKDNVKAAFWEIRHVGPGQATGLKKVVSSSAKIYGVAGGVRVIDASGSVSVYTVDGRLVSTGAVVSPDQTIAVPAGIYIVKNGVNAVKVVVK